MSAVVRTTTPFVIESVLITALADMGAEPVKLNAENIFRYRHNGSLRVGDILTNRSDYNGRQHFRLENARWVLRHDSEEMNGRVISQSAMTPGYQRVGRFLQGLGEAYQRAYKEHIERLEELEKQRIEEERKAHVEAIRQNAIAKARSQGYQIKENRANGKIQLVLTRTVF